MSLSAIRDGLLANLIASGKWDSTEVSACDFGVAEYSASCVVIQPGPNSRFFPVAGLGRSACGSTRIKRKEWSIAGIGLVKDQGDPRALLGDLWTLSDDLFSAIDADDTLNGAAWASHITLMSRPSIDAFVSDGNIDWGYITFTLEATEI
jgi:hypothetical protein